MEVIHSISVPLFDIQYNTFFSTVKVRVLTNDERTVKKHGIFCETGKTGQTELDFCWTPPGILCPVNKNGTKRREEALVNNIDLRTRLEWNLRIAMENVARIDRAIGELDEAEQIVFCGYYLDFKSVDWLAEELGLKKSQTYQIKEDAERRFVTMEYGVIE